MWMVLFAGCLIDAGLYEQRTAELSDVDGDGSVGADDCDDDDASVYPGAIELCDDVDQDCDGVVDDGAIDAVLLYADDDGDGFGDGDDSLTACEAVSGAVATGDDCDDSDNEVHPGAADTWYDGIDADCVGDDDHDADIDGDPAADHGGTDCDDHDPTIAGTLAEGWWDAGVDNNCDGSIEDQALLNAADIEQQIAGDVEGGGLGEVIQAVPAGWVDDEAIVLVAAPLSGPGDVYGWRVSDLMDGATVASAPWHIEGQDSTAYLGFGLAWLGALEAPLVAVSAEGIDALRGTVSLYDRAGWPATPVATVEGPAAGGAFGAHVVSGHDQDGDGVNDLIVSAPADSTVAEYAGSVGVFLDPTSLTGVISGVDADMVFTSTYAGSLLSVASLGDTDEDGLDDLGFSQYIAFDDGPGGLIVTGARVGGSYDVEGESVAQVWGGGNAFGQARDFDNDGALELVVASGGVAMFTLPLAGVVTPWDHASAVLSFESSSDVTTALSVVEVGDTNHATFLNVSSSYSGSKGAIAVEQPFTESAATAADARFMVAGNAAGDGLGTAFAALDWTNDGYFDVVIGAPGVDEIGTGAGIIYCVQGPN